MKKKNQIRTVAFFGILIITILSVGVFIGGKYITDKMLEASENGARDEAQIIANNFRVTDAEIEYMKTLTFTEMEEDPINKRLMQIVEGYDLSEKITNLYVIAKLKNSEVKYTADESNHEFFGCEKGTPLKGMWLFNGAIDDGKFKIVKRDDLYRYTDLNGEIQKALDEKEAFGVFSSDEWGNFITGYAPLYTVEGNFVGMLGLDLNPKEYQSNVALAIKFITFIYLTTIIVLFIILIILYRRYLKNLSQKVYFDFYSRMSHDMRTPMNGIIGVTHLAQDENDVEELHYYFDKIKDSSNYLLSLINDTLDVSKISNGKMELNLGMVRYQDVLYSVTDMTSNLAEMKHIDFKVIYKGFDSDCFINADEIRLKQVFINVITNAIKYTNDGGKIEFSVYCKEEDGKYKTQCFVKDNGVGMSPEFIKNNLFLPFSQEHNTMTDKTAGSGLGLTITKKLVQLMGGEIHCESKVGEGTTFSIDLEFEKIEPPTVRTTIKEKFNLADNIDKLKDKEILLCEDHPLNIEIATKLLEKVGCKVYGAETGAKGVDMFTKSPEGFYDCILMDIRMPEMDGLEASKQIRALSREDAKQIPIIAMTANAYAEDINDSREAGMDAHLSKPINPKLLYETLIIQMSNKNEKL